MMDRKARMLASVRGEHVDRVPVGMWYHFNPKLSAEDMAREQYAFVHDVDLDVIKIMYDNDYILPEPITKATDWNHIMPLGTTSPFYQKQRELLLRLMDAGQGEYPVWMTMFGAFKFAVMAAGDGAVMTHCRENPEAVKSGVRAIADTLCEWAEGYLSTGADAIFYSAQFGEVGRFCKDEWQEMVEPFDLQVLHMAESKPDKYSILHLCGEPEYNFKVHLDRYAQYPGSMVNWAVYPNHYELERGADLFARPVMGGLDNHGVMAHGTAEEVAAETCRLIERYGTAGYMLGADCSIEGPHCVPLIKAAVEAAKACAIQP